MLIFAHRGASGYEPENTLLAVDKALQMNVHAIEIDVHECDGHLVVIHDHWVDKTTNGHGKVADFSFNQLRQLDAGKQQKIPSLDEVLARISGRCIVNIELKSATNLALVLNAIDDAIRQYGFGGEQILVSSFNHHVLKHLKQQRPNLLIGALTASCPVDYARFAQDLDAYSIHIDIDVISQEFVNDAHKRGLQVYVYTVDKGADILFLKNINVDGIFSNYPDASLQALNLSKI